MILKEYYEQKKQAILKKVGEEGRSINVELFNDSVFTNTDYNFPLILFKYKNIVWNTSSEQEYKADVEFSICVVLSPTRADYLEVFDIANQVDQAILLNPTRGDIIQNKDDISLDDTILPLITNSTFKTSEGQYVVEDDFWEKNNFFIWEINYKTTLIETAYKKRYALVSNGFFEKKDLRPKNIEELRNKLSAIGFDLNDYHLVERDGKKLLEIKKIKEQLVINKDITSTLKK